MLLVDGVKDMTKIYFRYYGKNSNEYLLRLHNMNEFNST